MDIAKVRKKARKKKETKNKGGKASRKNESAVKSPETGLAGAEEIRDESTGTGRPEEQADQEPRKGIPASVELLSFQLGSECYAFHMNDVQEIINLYNLTPVPTGPEHLCGLISLRGRIIPVLDLTKLLKPDSSTLDNGTLRKLSKNRLPTRRKEKVIVAKGGRGPIGVLTDQVVDVIRVSEDSLNEPPTHLTESEVRFIESVSIHSGRFITVLKSDAALFVFEDKFEDNKEEEHPHS